MDAQMSQWLELMMVYVFGVKKDVIRGMKLDFNQTTL